MNMKHKKINNNDYVKEDNHINNIPKMVIESFKKIAPFWPLRNLIAVNPLKGFEDLLIEKAFETAAAYFQQDEIPEEMETINRETIKWLQVYLDEGQATITMPLRNKGFYIAWKKLALYDKNLHKNNNKKQEWIKNLPENAEHAVNECLRCLSIAQEEVLEFLTLMLTTLPGWAGYIKYQTEWTDLDIHCHPISQLDYLAMRLIITILMWPEAKNLIGFHKKAITKSQTKNNLLKKIQETENAYRLELLQNLAKQSITPQSTPEAQLVFCIDVRSEPFRKNLESIGNYQTYGFAGFLVYLQKLLMLLPMNLIHHAQYYFHLKMK